ncbi:MAG: acyltransferase [Armatimonadetes bacterium]|nr:acyltransferase [Armatimonadota bacterium]
MARMPKRERGNLGKSRLPFIEGLRGIAALYVVLEHFCSMADPRPFSGQTSHASIWVQSFTAWFMHGHLAVAVFIVISGFCMQMSLFPGRDGKIRSFRTFFARRARRILPPYYACLLLSALVAIVFTSRQHGMPFEQYVPVTWENFGAHVALIQNWSPDWMYKINGVLWSISIEAQLYLVFPILVALLFFLRPSGLVAFATAVSVALLLAMDHGQKLHIWYLGLFALGMAAAFKAYRPNRRKGVRPGQAVLVFLGSALAVGAGVVLIPASWAWKTPVTDAAAGAAVASLMYAGAVNPNLWITWPFGFKPVALLGTISYSLYLMHHPVQQLLYAFRPAQVVSEEDLLRYFLTVGTPVILVACALFWYVFERPFLNSLAKDSNSAGQRAKVEERYKPERSMAYMLGE